MTSLDAKIALTFSGGVPATVHVHLADSEAILEAVRALSTSFDQMGAEMEIDLSEVTAAIESETTVIAGTNTLLDLLVAQIDALAAQPTVDPADVAGLAAAVRANRDALAAAVLAHTPAAPPA